MDSTGAAGAAPSVAEYLKGRQQARILTRRTMTRQFCALGRARHGLDGAPAGGRALPPAMGGRRQPAPTSIMDTLGFEPRAFRMRSGCDTTTPCALCISAARMTEVPERTPSVEQRIAHPVYRAGLAQPYTLQPPSERNAPATNPRPAQMPVRSSMTCLEPRLRAAASHGGQTTAGRVSGGNIATIMCTVGAAVWRDH